MNTSSIHDLNIGSFTELITPNKLLQNLQTNSKIDYTVFRTREIIADIISNKDKRLLFIVGPCSIHNIEEAIEYGHKLKDLSSKIDDKIIIVMRVYFEKPRTTIGWKGLINDPYLNNTFDINKGLYYARKLLLDLNKIGMPCAYEILDTITPQYIIDLISWGAIGARTTESQIHRQLVSGLSTPIGFKNGTDGNLDICADAIISAKYPHCFMGINKKGLATICHTKGNTQCHIILRGGKDSPNYSSEHIKNTEEKLNEKNLDLRIMVDCSHGNSRKQFEKQPDVFKDVMGQYISNYRENKDSSIMGVMIESNINEGSQKLDMSDPDASLNLKKGVSITDGCLNFKTTEKIIMDFYNKLKTTKKYK